MQFVGWTDLHHRVQSGTHPCCHTGLVTIFSFEDRLLGPGKGALKEGLTEKRLGDKLKTGRQSETPEETGSDGQRQEI